MALLDTTIDDPSADSTAMAAETWEQLTAIGTATLHEAQNQTGAMDHAIKPIDPAMRLAGRALTVSARPGDNLIVHHALTKARPGDVMIIDAKGFLEGGLWGDILTEAAMRAGITGVVVDGAVRDSSTICELGFPVFARGLSIKGTLKHQPGVVNGPVVCGGVPVRPGDIVVGDRDGVVVIPSRTVDHVMLAARDREQAERALRDGIRQGQSTVALLKLEPLIATLGLV